MPENVLEKIIKKKKEKIEDSKKNISSILLALNFASLPIRFSNLSAFMFNSFGSITISDITLFFN